MNTANKKLSVLEILSFILLEDDVKIVSVNNDVQVIVHGRAIVSSSGEELTYADVVEAIEELKQQMGEG